MRTLHTKDQNDSSLFEGLKRAGAAQPQERRLAEQRRGRAGSRIKGEGAALSARGGSQCSRARFFASSVLPDGLQRAPRALICTLRPYWCEARRDSGHPDTAQGPSRPLISPPFRREKGKETHDKKAVTGVIDLFFLKKHLTVVLLFLS